MDGGILLEDRTPESRWEKSEEASVGLMGVGTIQKMTWMTWTEGSARNDAFCVVSCKHVGAQCEMHGV
jgi:hypothetical protein